MWHQVRNGINKIDNAGGLAAGAIVLLMLFMLAANTLLRYLFNYSWYFAEEYTSYGLIFLTFIPLAYTLKEKGHITIDVLLDRLPKRVRNCVSATTTVISLIVMAVLLRYGIELVINSLHRGSRSNTVMLTPLWIPQMFIVVGLILFIPEVICYLVSKINALKQERFHE